MLASSDRNVPKPRLAIERKKPNGEQERSSKKKKQTLLQLRLKFTLIFQSEPNEKLRSSTSEKSANTNGKHSRRIWRNKVHTRIRIVHCIHYIVFLAYILCLRCCFFISSFLALHICVLLALAFFLLLLCTHTVPGIIYLLCIAPRL